VPASASVAPKAASVAPQTAPAQAAPTPVPAPNDGQPAAPTADKPASDSRAPFLGEPDDLLADVESEVDDNAFKW
jgi:hypothetical protein